MNVSDAATRLTSPHDSANSRLKNGGWPTGWPTLSFDFLAPILNEAAPPSAMFRGWVPVLPTPPRSAAFHLLISQKSRNLKKFTAVSAACVAQGFYPFALHWTRQG